MWVFDGIEGHNAYAMMKCTRCGYQTLFRMNPFPCPMCKEKERKMDSFEFTLHSPLTDEEWDLITDVDFDHTDSITFQTKNGKEVRFVKEGQEKQKEPCGACGNLENGDTLYSMSDWDGGIGFDYIRDIEYCPVCGRKL